MTELERLQELYDAKLELANEEENRNKTLIENYIKSLTPNAIEVSTSINYSNEISIDIDFLNENGERDFHSSFNLYYRSDYDWKTHTQLEPVMSMNCGTFGAYTSKEYPYAVARCHLMSAIWNHEKELTELFASLDFKAQDELKEIRHKANQEKYRLEKEKDEQLKKQATEKIKVGAQFKEEVFKRYWNYDTCEYETRLECERDLVITKITPKRVYLEASWTVKEEYSKGQWIDGSYKYTGTSIGHRDIKKSGYISIDSFRDFVVNQLQDKQCSIWSRVSGEELISNPFTEDRFEVYPD